MTWMWRRQRVARDGHSLKRARTVETHPAMIEMIAEMLEREPEPCDAGCCAAPVRAPMGARAENEHAR